MFEIVQLVVATGSRANRSFSPLFRSTPSLSLLRAPRAPTGAGGPRVPPVVGAGPPPPPLRAGLAGWS
jgi:hypothetical protein